MQVSRPFVSSRSAAVSRPRTVRVQASAAKKIKLIYFSLAGRAETTRLLFTIGKVPFEDFRFQREQWPEIKAQMPYGQVPVLEVDGKQLAQTNAIERYAAKLVGLYPTDEFEAAQVDSMVNFIQELQDCFLRTFFVKDPAEKATAVKEVVEGALSVKLAKLDSILSAPGSNGYLVNGKLTWADLSAFAMTSSLISGFFTGIPTDLYDKFPAVTAHRKRIGSMPEIKAFYEAQKDDATRNSFRV